jgi:hypothetical protein
MHWSPFSRTAFTFAPVEISVAIPAVFTVIVDRSSNTMTSLPSSTLADWTQRPVERQLRCVRLCPGVIKLVMCGDEPSHVPDEVIAEIRAREPNGAIELLTLNRRKLRFQL